MKESPHSFRLAELFSHLPWSERRPILMAGAKKGLLSCYRPEEGKSLIPHHLQFGRHDSLGVLARQVWQRKWRLIRLKDVQGNGYEIRERDHSTAAMVRRLLLSKRARKTHIKTLGALVRGPTEKVPPPCIKRSPHRTMVNHR